MNNDYGVNNFIRLFINSKAFLLNPTFRHVLSRHARHYLLLASHAYWYNDFHFKLLFIAVDVLFRAQSDVYMYKHLYIVLLLRIKTINTYKNIVSFF